MKKLIAFFSLCAIFLFPAKSFSQNPDSSRYISVAYMKSKTRDYVSIETTLWKSLHQELIKQGKQSAWYLYRVRYPRGTKADYDFVAIDVYREWNNVNAPYANFQDVIKKVYPKMNPDSLINKTERSREIAWEQLYQLIGQAVAKEKTPSRFIVVNEVKTVAGQENEYVKMEQTWFKPFHASRAASGIMNNWGLYKRTLPYGEKFPYDYVTLNGFLNWEDITKNNPPDAWKKVHGDTNFNEVHEKILSKRITVNNEVWELIDYAQ